ncbi:cysteine proteinase inhibitor 5-like [Rosa chinensis]|uniref:cysteine proteinase inhibitor 5-like n=1 Tax=Rosa chinensis TaxID=74649 RepID=UPI000D08EC0A|nr:cysteine proteinase inhibitor 5-like [Rosa chinensis]
MRAHYVLALLALLYPLFAAGASAPTGQWKPVDLHDPLVTDIGKFAVYEYNYQYKKDLFFQNVTNGTYKDVAYSSYSNATLYQLVITVQGYDKTPNPKLAVYQATVFRRTWDRFKKLLSFVKISK